MNIPIEPCIAFTDREVDALENTWPNSWPAKPIIPNKPCKARFSLPCMDAAVKFPAVACKVEFSTAERGAFFVPRLGGEKIFCRSPFWIGDVLHVSEPVSVRGVTNSKGVGVGSGTYPPPFAGHVEIERLRMTGPGYSRYRPSKYVRSTPLADAIFALPLHGVGVWKGVIPRAFAQLDRLVVRDVQVQALSEMTLGECEGEGAVPDLDRTSDKSMPSRELLARNDFREAIFDEHFPSLTACDAFVFAFTIERKFADAMGEKV